MPVAHGHGKRINTLQSKAVMVAANWPTAISTHPPALCVFSFSPSLLNPHTVFCTYCAVDVILQPPLLCSFEIFHFAQPQLSLPRPLYSSLTFSNPSLPFSSTLSHHSIRGFSSSTIHVRDMASTAPHSLSSPEREVIFLRQGFKGNGTPKNMKPKTLNFLCKYEYVQVSPLQPFPSTFSSPLTVNTFPQLLTFSRSHTPTLPLPSLLRLPFSRHVQISAHPSPSHRCWSAYRTNSPKHARPWFS